MTSLAPGQVVVEAAGVCLSTRGLRAERSGRVIAAGPGSEAWTGQAVVVPSILPCGDCALCRRGLVASCEAVAPTCAPGDSLTTVAARWLCAVSPTPDGGGEGRELWRYAALSDAGLVSYTALTTLGVGPGELVLIHGTEARGLFAVALAKMLSAIPVVIGGDHEQRAREVGAALWLPAELPPDDVEGEVRRALGEDAPSGPSWRALDTTGAESSRLRCLDAAPVGATVALVRAPERARACATRDDSAAAVLDHLVDRELRLLGIGGPHPDLLPELVAHVERGELPLEALTTGVEENDLPGRLEELRRAGTAAAPIAIRGV